MGSYAGPLAVADSATCPSLAGGVEAFSASRYNRKLYRFPIGADGSVEPCPAGGAACELDLDPDLLDPAAVGVACRADGKRQSLFVGYLRSPTLGSVGAGTAWMSEFDLGDLAQPPRTFVLGPGPVGDMAYDHLTDRLYAVGRFAGFSAPLFILELPACKSSDPANCPEPRLQTVDLYPSLAGAELVGIALSNFQPGRPRRAYISVRVYDEVFAAAIRARPSFDVGGALLVVDLEEDVVGQPSARVLSVVPIGLGAGTVVVLPVRPGLGDLVVVPSSGDGSIQVYDDEVGAVVRQVSVDQATGAPQAGHAPYAAAVEDRGDRGAGLRRVVPGLDGERPPRSPGRPHLGGPDPPLRRAPRRAAHPHREPQPVNRLAPWLLAVVAFAGCAKNTSRPSAKMNGPQGVAVYQGFGTDQPGVLRPLVAVANTRGDDLRIIDAVTDKVLAGPTVVEALSVPTEPRPSLIAAGSLHDQSTAGANVLKADLLVVAPRGLVVSDTGGFGAVIQSIVTWDAQARVKQTIELGGLAPDGALTALLVAPVWEEPTPGVLQKAANKARVLASTTTGELVSILATRDPDDATNPTNAIVLGPPVAQPLGFACLDLALSTDGKRIYAATLDPIPGPGGVLGVAEFDNTVAAGPMPVRALSAPLGTTVVAAIEVRGFQDNTTDPDFDTLDPLRLPRVYAVLDPAGCGRDRSMPCGIAVFDPALGTLAADPAGELPYQLPIQVPGEVVDIAVSGPPVKTDKEGYLKFDPGSGLRWTQAFAGVATTSGRIYLVDLSHYGVGNALSPLVGSSATRVINSASYLPTTDSAAIGIWWEPLPTEGTPAELPSVQFDSLALRGIAVTPGYTSSETFTITYQGKLPGLSSRRAVAHVTSGAPSWIAIQDATGLTGPGTSPWRSVARLYDPRLAVRVGDFIDVEAFPGGTCPGGTFEMQVSALLPPDPVLYPGGAVAVTPSASQVPGADPACLPQGQDSVVTVSFMARDLVLTGTVAGYAGRPDIVFGSPETATRFEFKYVDERTLACPIMPDDPQAWPPAAGDIAACEADVATCRATCERLVLARRARRSFYMTDGCPPVTGTGTDNCRLRWERFFGLSFPMPKGPVVAFKVGVTDPDQGAVLKRGAYLFFNTGSGFLPGSRAPSAAATGTGATAPYGVTLFDRSAVTNVANDGIHGYAAFADNLVLDFAPWSNVAPSTTIR